MADVDSTEQRARLGVRERFGTGTLAGAKARGVVRLAGSGDDAVGARQIESSPDDGDALQLARVELACRLRSQKTEHGEAICAHMRSVAPHAGVDDDPFLAAGLHEMVAACIDCCLAGIELGSQWSGPTPPAVVAQVHRAASCGVDLATALSRCVAAYTLAWNIVLDDVAAYHTLGDEQMFALLGEASAAIGSVLARVEAEIAEAQSAEIRRRARSREQRRAEIVRRLLAGELVDASELVELGYDLDAWHVALIAIGAGAEQAVRSLAAGLHRRLLPIPQDAETVWAWLGSENRPTFDEIERVHAKSGRADVSLAFGEPARGVEGWRTTHQEAQGAVLVARDRPSSVTRYLDVALDAAALQDDALADSLIEKYLSPLEDVPVGGEMARRTVRALFDTEHSVSSAANALSVHRSSVHRWREQIEQRLGYRLHEHQTEIELALRVEGLRKHRLDARSLVSADRMSLHTD